MMIFIYILVVACCIKFLHYCIGSPIQGEFYSGRIFSSYGRWISYKYNDFEEREKKRVYSVFETWKHAMDIKLQNDLKTAAQTETEAIYKHFVETVDKEYKRIEHKMKPNPFSMLGACPICFGTWVGLILWTAICLLNPFQLWWILIGSPTSVVLSRYIKIQ